MRHFFCLILCLCLSFPVNSQSSSSPYKTDVWKDGAWITAGLGLNVAGVLLIQNKDELTEADIAAIDKDDIWAIDRWAAGNSSKRADELSYIPFYTSFALPLLFLAGEDERSNFGQISVLFVETMATTGALFTLTAGAVQRSRPLVYNESLPMGERTDSDAQRSFFAGHTAATAAATFFTAKVFQDFNPDSPALPYVWTGAAVIPAFVGYLRMEGGKHFISDNLVGLGIGAACGILIPEIHKTKNESVSLYPTAQFNLNGTGINSRGIGVSYSF
ncbi:phosphatase PAP2 family protein [Salegentibacter sp. F188]|uniref:Phosphatase PAP2 family protein n=1 Tax=Autumnicola patrickiae TaxID=3075591 RepID=A0ABU3E3K4_9FLAO|nr:phosphatase PAP2 family protein [Salegentibacter sp. F188]MDT0689847.1 phosphatase PAP2 family protein [Salegentibacter sp. F188]